MFKNTALASVISVTELFLVTEETTEQSFRFLEAYAAAAIMYLLMTAAWSLIQMWIERATFVPGTRPRPKPIPRPPVVAYLRRVIPIG
jgi:ABC-type amino acid transport system permease subunit